MKQPTHLEVSNPFHKRLASILSDLSGLAPEQVSQLNANLVTDLGLDPVKDGFLLSIELEKAHPSISPGVLSWVENRLDQVRVRDLCDSFGGLAWV